MNRAVVNFRPETYISPFLNNFEYFQANVSLREDRNAFPFDVCDLCLGVCCIVSDHSSALYRLHTNPTRRWVFICVVCIIGSSWSESQNDEYVIGRGSNFHLFLDASQLWLYDSILCYVVCILNEKILVIFIFWGISCARVLVKISMLVIIRL